MVTGVGSVGIAVAQEFAQEGYDVISYDLDPTPPRMTSVLKELTGKVTSVRGDVRDSCRMMDIVKQHKPEGIVHTAALTVRGSGITFPTGQFSVNAEGTLNVLEAARIMGVSRVIFTSSISVFSGISPGRVEPLRETEHIDPFGFASFYSVAKYTSEMLMGAYHRLCEMDTITCRLDSVYGIGEIKPRDIGAFLWAVLKGEKIVEASGADVEGDYCYSKDVADGIYILYTSKKITDPRIYHLSNGRKDRLGDIVETINAMGAGKVHLGPGKEGKYSLAKYGPISAPFDISRLKELGFKPRSTKQALDDYAAWIRSEIKEGRTG
jgi:nucleoside-diphosphate-sugar epimerase